MNLGPRVVSPHSQGLQGSHLNLSQTSAKRQAKYFLLNNKVCELKSFCNSISVFTLGDPALHRDDGKKPEGEISLESEPSR